MNVLPAQKPSVTVYPLLAVVVAADHHDLSLRQSLMETGNKLIQQFHCLGPRNRLIVYIAGDQDSIRPLFLCILYDLLKHILLFLFQIIIH